MLKIIKNLDMSPSSEVELNPKFKLNQIVYRIYADGATTTLKQCYISMVQQKSDGSIKYRITQKLSESHGKHVSDWNEDAVIMNFLTEAELELEIKIAKENNADILYQ